MKLISENEEIKMASNNGENMQCVANKMVMAASWKWKAIENKAKMNGESVILKIINKEKLKSVISMRESLNERKKYVIYQNINNGVDEIVMAA